VQSTGSSLLNRHGNALLWFGVALLVLAFRLRSRRDALAPSGAVPRGV
jgi:hypothetical protein